MKLNLLLDNHNDVRSGYVNVDPFAPEQDKYGRVRADVNNLDAVVEAGEATKIVVSDILSYFPPEQVDEILTNWLSKLAHGGTLAVTVVDLREVARKFLANIIPIEDMQSLLHGAQEQPWQFRKSSLTLPLLIEVFTTRGYKILSKRIQNNMATVVVQRA